MELRFFLLQLVTPVVSVVLLGPLVLYAIARWRMPKDASDPQLGLKFALHYFATLAFHVTLAGATLLIYTMIRPGGEEGGSKSQLYRLAFGFLVPGAIILGAHVALLLRTNDAQLTSVRRLFAGFNLIITGLVGFAALVLGFQALFAKGSTDGMGHLGGAAILIYGGAWGVLAWRFTSMVFGGGSASAPPMPEIVSPPAVAPPAAGGGLPPLGGGSYPPIERH